MSPQILFEDTHVIVLAKPAGLLSQGESTGDENLVDWLRTYLGRPYVGLVHRLDRNTSGIMIVGKRTKAASRLTEALQQGKLTRTYLAWVEGDLRSEVRWRHFLEKDEKRNLVRVVKSGSRGQESALRATPRAHGEWRGYPATLVEYELETGRSHQIRVQSAHEGFPLVGDRKYNPKARVCPDFPRPALHSCQLTFPHPMSGEVMKFEAALPEDLQELARELGQIPNALSESSP